MPTTWSLSLSTCLLPACLTAACTDTDFNIGVIAPGRDYEAGTYGILGNFDGNRNNDLNLRLTPVRLLLCHLLTTRVVSLCAGVLTCYMYQQTIDLFNHVPRCCTNPPPPPPHLCPNYVQPAFIPPVLDNPDVEGRLRLANSCSASRY